VDEQGSIRNAVVGGWWGMEWWAKVGEQNGGRAHVKPKN